MLSRIWFILLLAVCLASCTKRVTYTFCDNYANKDSLIQCIVTNYDIEAYDALWCCHEDSDMDLYGFLIADSNGIAGYYTPSYYLDGSSCYGLSDTVMLFYDIKGVVMGCYASFGGNLMNRYIDIPDSIYNTLFKAFVRFGVSVWDKDKYRKEYDNIDSLFNVVLINTDIESYDKLRLLTSRDSLSPISIDIANKTHYPVACYDVYYNTIRGYRLDDKEFQFAYKYLCEAADSIYYPALFIKAGLCLTGAYFPQDTVLGKKLFEQCHATTTIPFWQQYLKPVVYQHLLKK